jgi:hypothetical protein
METTSLANNQICLFLGKKRMAINWPKFKDFDLSEVKSRPMKFLILWFCILFALTLLFFFGKAISGRYVNVFGWEPNGPYRKDTILYSKKDTFFISTPTIGASLPKVETKKQQVGTNKSKQTNKEGDNNYVQGNNNGIVGGENNTQNNYGIIPRVITEQEVYNIISVLSNREMVIKFIAYDGVDAEMNAVKDQFITHFKKFGYKNYELSFYHKYGFTPPEEIRLDTVPNENTLLIHIPHQKQ